MITAGCDGRYLEVVRVTLNAHKINFVGGGCGCTRVNGFVV